MSDFCNNGRVTVMVGGQIEGDHMTIQNGGLSTSLNSTNQNGTNNASSVIKILLFYWKCDETQYKLMMQ